jgi:hypothetical protein
MILSFGPFTEFIENGFDNEHHHFNSEQDDASSLKKHAINEQRDPLKQEETVNPGDEGIEGEAAFKPLIPRFIDMNPCTTHPASPPDHHNLLLSLVVGWGGGAGGMSQAQRALA